MITIRCTQKLRKEMGLSPKDLQDDAEDSLLGDWYQRAIQRFLDWCESRSLGLANVTPAIVGRYLDGLPGSAPSKKVYLAAIRHFFDVLVQRHVVLLNPAASVRGDRYVAIEGKTPEITAEQARRLLASIDTSRLVGLRDKSILAVLVYTAARVGAVANLCMADFYDAGDQHCLRFIEKGGRGSLLEAST